VYVPLVPVGTMVVSAARRQSLSCSPVRRPASWSGTANQEPASTLSPSSECSVQLHFICLLGSIINEC